MSVVSGKNGRPENGCLETTGRQSAFQRGCRSGAARWSAARDTTRRECCRDYRLSRFCRRRADPGLQGFPDVHPARRHRDQTFAPPSQAPRALTFLLDTNVVSELARTRPNSNVLAWLSSVPSTDLFLSVITL